MPDQRSAYAPRRGYDSRPAWDGWLVFQCLRPTRLVAVIPAVECRGQDAERLQRPARRQMGSLDQADDLQFLRSWVPHSSPSPSAIMLFLSRRSSRACSATCSVFLPVSIPIVRTTATSFL